MLPLLHTAVMANGWVATQAVPGPLFTLGALLPLGPAWSPWMGGLLVQLASFLPAALQLWAQLRQRPRMRQAATDINAAVVGILAATWYHPVLTSAIGILLDLGLALLYLGLLLRRLPAAACCGGGPGGWVGVGAGLKPPTLITVSIKKRHQGIKSK